MKNELLRTPAAHAHVHDGGGGTWWWCGAVIPAPRWYCPCCFAADDDVSGGGIYFDVVTWWWCFATWWNFTMLLLMVGDDDVVLVFTRWCLRWCCYCNNIILWISMKKKWNSMYERSNMSMAKSQWLPEMASSKKK